MRKIASMSRSCFLLIFRNSSQNLKSNTESSLIFPVPQYKSKKLSNQKFEANQHRKDYIYGNQAPAQMVPIRFNNNSIHSLNSSNSLSNYLEMNNHPIPFNYQNQANKQKTRTQNININIKIKNMNKISVNNNNKIF